MAYDVGALRKGLEGIAKRIEESADELNSADSQLGDGDLGVTMSRGMQEINGGLAGLPEDMGRALFACAKGFTKTSGSSYGTLLASGLMAAAKQCKGKATVECSEVAGLVDTALEAMIQRGKGELGAKTVLDMVDALRADLAGKDAPEDLADAAVGAAKRTLDEYRDKECRIGRARMFGEKSSGLDDPGMLALARILEGCTGRRLA